MTAPGRRHRQLKGVRGRGSGRPRRKPGPQSQALALPPLGSTVGRVQPASRRPTGLPVDQLGKDARSHDARYLSIHFYLQASCSGLGESGRRTSRSASRVLERRTRSARNARAGHRARLGLRFVSPMPQVLPVRRRIRPIHRYCECSYSNLTESPADLSPRRGEPDAGLSRSGCAPGSP